MDLKRHLMASAAAFVVLGLQGAIVSASARAIPEADSYAALLQPVPDAAERLSADDAAHEREAGVQTAQIYFGIGHHHHHHHHWRRYYHHHHHHHHFYRHHHHHHHHHWY